MIHSMLDLSERLCNRQRRFGSDTRYYPAWVLDEGAWRPALFTAPQIHEAMLRAERNPEDVPSRARSWWGRLFGG